MTYLNFGNIYLLSLTDDMRKVVVTAMPIPQYEKFSELLKFIDHHNDKLIAVAFRCSGFSEIVDEIVVSKGNGVNERMSSIPDDSCVDCEIIRKRMYWLQMKKAIDNMPSFAVDFAFTQEDADECIGKLNLQLDVYYKIVDYVEGIHSELISFEDDNEMGTFMLTKKVLVDGRPYAYIMTQLQHSNMVAIRRLPPRYDMPQWLIRIAEDGYLRVIHKRKDFKDFSSTDELLSKIFGRPSDYEGTAKVLADKIKSTFNKVIAQDAILYDWVRKCYCLKKEIENRLIPTLNVQLSTATEVVKYTSLDTLMAMLMSEKMRINSIVAMNDKTEVPYLLEQRRNFTEEGEDEGDKWKLANRKFIASFTTRKDDLDMWRFYGDDAKGVCLVFRDYGKSSTPLYKITYIDSRAEAINQLKTLMKELQEIHQINFRLAQFDNNSVFIKPKEYESEEEHRLLLESKYPDGWCVNSDNMIVMPFLEKCLFNRGIPDLQFPLDLVAIILGPKMPQKEINKYQLQQLLISKGLHLDVKESDIESYR